MAEANILVAMIAVLATMFIGFISLATFIVVQTYSWGRNPGKKPRRAAMDPGRRIDGGSGNLEMRIGNVEKRQGKLAERMAKLERLLGASGGRRAA